MATQKCVHCTTFNTFAMNVFSITQTLARVRLAFACCAALCLGQNLQGQGAFKPLVSLTNANVRDTLSGVNLAVYPSSPVPKHGTVTKTQIVAGGGSNPHVYEVKYTPTAGYVGLDTFVVELNYNGQTPFLLYKAYAVQVVPSILRVQNDFAVTPLNTTVTIPVALNDYSSAGGLNVTAIPSIEYGTATILSGNQIQFNPQAGFKGIAHLTYAICDQNSHCKTGSVNISVHNGQPLSVDTLYLTTVKNTKVDHVLSFDGYTLFAAPDSGTVNLVNGFTMSYVPKLGYAGSESFTLVNNAFGAPRYLHVITSVINTPSLNAMAMDDYIYTPKNQAITFNVRSNDIGNLNVVGWTPPIGSQGTISGTNPGGNVTFTPANNFKGVASFKYRIGSLWNNNVETATAYVVVGDLAPTQSTYVLSTPAETPLVINYRLPFIGFDFAVLQAPLQGTTAFYAGTTTFTHGTQSVTGTNLLVYTPQAGYTGADEMIVNYCITGTSSCHTVKIEINVTEVISSAGPYCLANCVWSGDVNADGIVNNKDILPLGYFMGEAGEDRPNASLEWYGQYADNWNNPFVSTSFDLKHADTDGNGVISIADTSAIHALYGSTHNLVPSLPATGKGLPFEYHLLTPNPQVGDLVQVEVQLGKTVDPALNVFGFTLDVTLSNNIVDSLFAMQYYANTWLNNNAASLAFSKNPRQGRLESAFTRIGSTPVSGMNDRIGRYEFIIIEVVDDFKGNVAPMLTMQMDGGQVLNNDGSYGYIEPVTLEIPVGNASGISTHLLSLVSDAQLIAYPSPAQDLVNIHLNGEHMIESVAVYNLTGQIVSQTADLLTERTQINTSALAEGVYLVRAMTTGGPVTKKIVVQRSSK
jgi:Secretion system C-terminal sorting domain/Bacterial Ig domain